MASDLGRGRSVLAQAAALAVEPTQLLRNFSAALRARWYLRKVTSVGPRVRVWGRPSVRNSGTMIVGDRARLISTIATLEIVVEKGATLEIGEGSYINYGCSIGATSLIRIGPRANIGTHVIMIDNDFHELDPSRRLSRPPSAPIILEENVWVGARAIILRGVTVGADSVIGAGSVVTHDIPPRSLAVGQPARVIRSL